MAPLRAADAAIVGKTNLHELACGGTGREPALRHAGEPVRPRVHPGRQLQRQRGGAGRRRGRHRHRQRHRRLHPQPVGVLRHGGPEDHVGTHPASRACGRWRRRSTPSGRWRATWPPRSQGWRCSNPGSRSRRAAPRRAGAATRRRSRHRRGRGRGARRVRARRRRRRPPRLGRRQRRRLGGDVPRVLGGRPPPLRARPGRPRRRHRRAHRAGPGRHRRRLRARARPTGPSGAPSWPPPSTDAPVLAWPTIAMFPTPIDGPVPNTRRTNLPVNHAGHPSLALPVPSGGRFPASVQLVGPDHSEDAPVRTGLVVEAAARTLA